MSKKLAEPDAVIRIPITFGTDDDDGTVTVENDVIVFTLPKLIGNKYAKFRLIGA
jgi:hypothetical protein